MNRIRVSFLAFVLCSFCNVTFANDDVKVTDLQYPDHSFLKSQRELANRISSFATGYSFKGTKFDLETLQRIVDKKVIPKTETKRLQALGVILGDVLKNELGLNWKVYEDSLGRSRALCVRNTNRCLFPVTMISRRYEVGATVNMESIYSKAKGIILPYIQNPDL